MANKSKFVISSTLVIISLLYSTCFPSSAHAEGTSLLDEEEDSSFEADIWDPLEPVNRGVFWFNDQLYMYLLRPAAIGYDYVLPQPAKTGIKNFYRNLLMPIDFSSNVLQLDFRGAGKSLGRFLINTTIGLLGTIDWATDCGLPDHNQDIGLAFARWGIPYGPYLVLPVLGPSTLRDAAGTGLETFVDPINYPTYYLDSFSNSDEWIYMGAVYSTKTLDAVNRKRDGIDAAKESSLDYYLFAQSAYYQYRGKASNLKKPVEVSESSEK